VRAGNGRAGGFPPRTWLGRSRRRVPPAQPFRLNEFRPWGRLIFRCG